MTCLCGMQAPALYAELQKQLKASQASPCTCHIRLPQQASACIFAAVVPMSGHGAAVPEKHASSVVCKCTSCMSNAASYSAQLGSGSESGMRMGGQKQSTKSSKDGWYDFGGWVLLIGITVGIMALARNSQPVAVGPPAK